MSKEFVERRDASFYLMGSRVPLAHIVREFQRGESPEAIRSHYPVLSLEQVYGRSPSFLEIRKMWKGIWRNVSAKRTLSPLPIQRLPKSK